MEIRGEKRKNRGKKGAREMKEGREGARTLQRHGLGQAASQSRLSPRAPRP